MIFVLRPSGGVCPFQPELLHVGPPRKREAVCLGRGRNFDELAVSITGSKKESESRRPVPERSDLVGKYGPFLCRLLWSDHEGPFQTGVVNAGEAHRRGVTPPRKVL